MATTYEPRHKSRGCGLSTWIKTEEGSTRETWVFLNDQDALAHVALVEATRSLRLGLLGFTTRRFIPLLSHPPGSFGVRSKNWTASWQHCAAFGRPVVGQCQEIR